MGCRFEFISNPSYQLAFRIPGRSPCRAISLKQIRHSPKCLIYALGLPHLLQRLYSLTPNRFGFFQLAIFDALAKPTSRRYARTL